MLAISHTDLLNCLVTTLFLSWQHSSSSRIQRWFVFYITHLQYPIKLTYNRSVWLYDANIDFTSGKYIPLFLSSLHSLASLWSVATGHITPEALLVGQQAETSHGFIPSSLQSKTSLLAWTTAGGSLCSLYGVCLQYSGRPQDNPARYFFRSWASFRVPVVQWWGLQEQVY